MVLVAFVGLIWLIVLQVTVNRLQEQIDRLKNSSVEKEDSAPLNTPDKAPLPTAQSTPEQGPQSPQLERHEERKGPAFQIAQPAKIYTATSQEPPKPRVEITAAKLFSWIGGFMLFLGMVFGIKYAVENSILTPAMRITSTTLMGIVLALVGYCIKKEKYRVTAHTLLGSGLAIVYAAVFCAHTFYHFIGLTPAFMLMAITSFAALGASLQKDAKYVGYLGAIIAFLTPILLSNGTDAWVAFFLYVFCINAAAAYSAVKKGWNGLLICTLCFTWLSQAAWLFPLENYKLLGVVTFFSLYAVASAWLARRPQTPRVISHAVGGFLTAGLALMLPVGAWLSAPVVANVPNTILSSLELIGYTLLVNGLILVWAGKEYISYFFARFAKVLSFLILCTWMMNQSSHLPLWLTLGACMLFAALNSGVELALCRNGEKPDGCSVFYPIATMLGLLVLSLLPGQAATLDFISLFCMLTLLLAGTLLLAVLAGTLWVSFIALGVLFLFLFINLFVDLGGYTNTYGVLLTGFIPLFLCAGIFSALRRCGKLSGISVEEKGVGAVTALTPFVLILTVIAQTGHTLLVNWVFATAFVVCTLTALTARLYKTTFTLPAAAVGAGLVQLALWGRLTFENASAFTGTLSVWAVIFLAFFIGVPFLSKEHFWDKIGPWIACALAGLSTCLIECLLLADYWQCNLLGLIPAALLGIYALLLRRIWGTAHPISIGFMSGAALLFLTVIFPLQIHNHWLCVAWAAEAVFLTCLHKQVPYRGWQIATAGLLCMVSSWLLLSGDFFPLPTVRIWNWYLWVYGLTAGALFTVAYWWDKPTGWKNAFYTLGGCMLFWLLNIEIAHWFNTGKYLSFNFTGELAQALTYTLAWGVFAFCTIGLGLRLQKNVVSKVGVGIMGLTLAKFFLSDIWQLQALYRILGLFGLAVLLIVASFWYQKKQKVQ